MKKCLFVSAGLLALVAVSAAHAGRVEADPNKEYPISPEAGPYVICVKAYVGRDAHELANRLVLHLRQQGWQAYMYDYSAEERRKNQELLDERYKNVPPEARMQIHKTIHVEDQFGVLVGGYTDFDSASKDIAKVKKTPEPPADPRFADVDFVDQETKQIYRLHTYAQCIATRNPTLPRQQVEHNGPDPAWKQLNDGRPYNLLKKCGKPWTLAVAQFQGTGVVQPRSAGSEFLNMIGMGGKSGDVLEASAAQAEEVARFLSSKPYNLKAFVLHTRTGSVVTVGAYDTADDEDLVRKAKLLAGKPIGATGIKFFDQPRPMQVPQL
jgi:hypothetical protein